MQPIVAVELDEADVVAACLDVGRILLVEVPQRLEVGMSGERRVVERDLGIEAGEPLDGLALGAVLAHDRERVDLDEVRVVREHRRDEALGDR